MPRTANKSGASTPRSNPAVNQAQAGDPNDAILDALNADRAAHEHGVDDKSGEAGRQAGSTAQHSPEKPARSRSTH